MVCSMIPTEEICTEAAFAASLAHSSGLSSGLPPPARNPAPDCLLRSQAFSFLLYDQPKSPDRSGTRVMPMRATPPPAISCFMPWDFAPGLSLPVYAPLRSAQSRRPPDVVRPSSRLIAPQIPRPAPSATTRVCSTPTALLKNAIVNSSLLDAGELPREMVMGSDYGSRETKRPSSRMCTCRKRAAK